MRGNRLFLALGLALGLAAAPLALSVPRVAAATVTDDVVVYGGTPGGVMAAVTAGRAGLRTALLEPTGHVGGMMSNGLGFTDIGDPSTLGGYTKEVFDRIQTVEGTVAGRYRFEPHVAERVFNDMLRGAGVTVYLGQQLDPTSVVKAGTRIVSLGTMRGTDFAASVFVDGSYEGDLLAAAGVSYAVGREAAADTGESLAGVRPTNVIMTVPAGTSPGYVTTAPGAVGSADNRIQDSNYRLCFSSVSTNQVPFGKPTGYAAASYAIVSAYLSARAKSTGATPTLSWVLTVLPVANHKYDVNAAGHVSMAVTGANYAWPDGDAGTRASIAAQHESWTRGLLYFLRNDPSVPSTIRSQMAGHGLCRDEFTDNASWPRQLYIREGRRMVGDYVMTQKDVTNQRSKVDIIGVGSYRIDSHAVSRWVDGSGRLADEGQLFWPYLNYAIPYRSLVPQASEVTNLIVTDAISASHVAYSSYRMEPDYLLAGEAAGVAAWLAMPRNGSPQVNVQDISIASLQSHLLGHGSFLHNLGSRGWL